MHYVFLCKLWPPPNDIISFFGPRLKKFADGRCYVSYVGCNYVLVSKRSTSGMEIIRKVYFVVTRMGLQAILALPRGSCIK